jgi:hypothetical protein
LEAFKNRVLEEAAQVESRFPLPVSTAGHFSGLQRRAMRKCIPCFFCGSIRLWPAAVLWQAPESPAFIRLLCFQRAARRVERVLVPEAVEVL